MAQQSQPDRALAMPGARRAKRRCSRANRRDGNNVRSESPATVTASARTVTPSRLRASRLACPTGTRTSCGTQGQLKSVVVAGGVLPVADARAVSP